MPVAIPLGALALIAIITFLVSQVLLNVPKEIATAVALMGAFNILAGCTFVAFSKGLDRTQLLMLAGVALLPVFLGGVAAAGVFGFPGEEEHGAKGEAAPAVEISANNLAFDKQELTIPAGKPFTINFDNQEAQPHNVAILKSQGSAEALFREPPTPGPKKITYNVKAIPEGTYYFQCDVHPNMNGTVKAETGAGGGGEGKAGGGVQISANNLAFDKKNLTVKADQPFKLTFDNKEPQPHNVAILKSQGSSEVFLREPPTPGPKKTTYDVKALPAGEYYFQCDVHPNMNGTVTAS